MFIGPLFQMHVHKDPRVFMAYIVSATATPAPSGQPAVAVVTRAFEGSDKR